MRRRDGGQGGLAFGFKIVVGVAQGAGERVVGVAVLRLPHDRVLSAGEIGEHPAQPVAFGVAFPRFPIIHSGQIGGEDGAPVGSENAFGEKARYGVHHGVFLDIDRSRVFGVLVGASPVVVLRPAHVIGGVVADGLAQAKNLSGWGRVPTAPDPRQPPPRARPPGPPRRRQTPFRASSRAQHL